MPNRNPVSVNRHFALLISLMAIGAGALTFGLHANPVRPPVLAAPAETTVQLGFWVDSVRGLGIGDSTILTDIDLPMGDEPVALHLVRFGAVTPEAQIVSVDADGRERPVDLSSLVLLRGQVDTDADSQVFISLSDFGVQGFIQFSGGLYSLSSGLVADGFGNPDDLRITKVEGPIGGMNVPPVTCGVIPDDPEFHPFGIEKPVDVEQLELLGRTDPPCRVVQIAVDTDWEYTASLFNGNVNAAAAYAVTLIAGVGEIYQNNLNVRLVVSYLRLFETNNDPYNQGGDLLQEFRNHWNATQGGVERDLAHLLSGRNNLPYGGVAYLSVMCSQQWGYGLSGYLNGSFPYPLINNNGGNWDLVVVAHELGHNFGTGHTHDSYTPPIDNCGNGDCAGAQNGTIMSYCHTCSGGISNITLNFHPLVRSRILNYLNNVGCNLIADGATAVDDSANTLQGTPVLIDALLNDQAASCVSVFINSFDAQSVQGGLVERIISLGGNGRDQFRYSPPAGFSGVDSFSYSVNGGDTATVSIDVLSLRAPDQTGPTTPGVGVEYYALNDPVVLPDFSTLTPYASDSFPTIAFPSTNGEFATSGRSDNVGAVFEGFVTVPAAALYTFFTESDDGSKLYIGETLVVDNDGLHGMQERSGQIALAPGPHAVRVEFFERGGGAGLIVRFQSQNISKRIIEQSRWSRSVECPGDVNGDGAVNLADLNLVLANFGQATSEGDANADGVVDLADLNLILSQFGQSCL